jgi:hypothetical protein
MLRLAALMLTAVPACADSLPFVGAWDCGIGVFTFTAESIDTGDRLLPILDVAAQDGSYVLTLPDELQFSLLPLSETAMELLSFASGDAFTCQRLD